MMNSETKRHIDSARQVLVGVVPNPTSQIEQITNALIYKFMDDMDQAAIKAGGQPSFFVEELAQYAWTRIMDRRIGSQERMNLYQEALLKFSQSKRLPELFRDVFKTAFLPYRSPEVLDLFLKQIDYFDYSHPEELGNAYEYLLSIMSSQGDAGQFRTPRNIIDFVVDIVNPTKDDKILDPACGTAGFLISAYNHILDKHNPKLNPDNKELTKDDKINLVKNFEGYDIDPMMVRIAQVNMYLHQFKRPQIHQHDSLSNDEKWSDKFDVILANPPFMSPKGGVKTHNKFTIESTRSEVLFVDYIMNHLRPKGKAGIIVPEGIIFQSGKAYKQLRKNMLEDGLYAVISLPSGIFNPYAGVKTSILLLDKELAKQKEEILFIKVENDGFDLGAQRRPIAKNDLPIALEIINKWNQGEKLDHKLALYIEKSKIAETYDYNLSGDRYRVNTDYTNTKWNSYTLKELEESGAITLGRGQVVSKKDLEANPGIYPVYSSSAQGNGEFGQYGKYMFDEELITWSVDGGGRFFYRPRHKFSVTNVSGWIRINYSHKINAKYFFRVLDTEWLEKSFDYVAKAHPSVIREMYKIPLPPLEIQEQIVAELDGYSAIINGAKQIVQNWKPKIDIDPEWEKVKLGDVCETTSGGTPLKSKSEYYEGGGIPWLRSGEVAQGFVRESELFITEKGLKNSSAKLLPINTVLVAMYGATAGQVGILKFESTTNQAVCGILPNDKFIPEFLFQVLKDQKEIMISFSGGGAQPNISQGVIRNLEIPLPPLTIQKQIVDKIEAERALVESTKKLIEIYEQKTKEAITKLWEE